MNKRTVKSKGKELELYGKEVNSGDQAPDFVVLNSDLDEVKLSDYKGKIVILSSVPSLETPVCDIQTHRFDEAVAKLGPEVEFITVSMDLPFGQKRWCSEAGTERVVTLSDHRDASFGQAFGVLIPDLRLLARAVFVIDGQGVVRHSQLVEDLGQEPNYDAVLRVVKELAT